MLKTGRLARVLIAQVLFASGALKRRARSRFRRTPMVLAYHRIIDDTSCCASCSYPHLHVSPRHFEQHVAFLSSFFEITTDWHKPDVKNNGGKKPRCIITFDDGWRDNYITALPILKRYGARAVVFATTNFIETQQVHWTHKLLALLRQHPLSIIEKLKAFGLCEHAARSSSPVARLHFFFNQINKLPWNRRQKAVREIERLFSDSHISFCGHRQFISWNEAREMTADGTILMGSHTVMHEPLTLLPFRLRRAELIRSRRILADTINSRINAMAFPHNLYDSESVTEVRRSGYAAAFGGRMDKSAPRYMADGFCLLPRINVTSRIYLAGGQTFSRALFLSHICGMFPSMPLPVAGAQRSTE